jgi:hypothetical protein
MAACSVQPKQPDACILLPKFYPMSLNLLASASQVFTQVVDKDGPFLWRGLAVDRNGAGTTGRLRWRVNDDYYLSNAGVPTDVGPRSGELARCFTSQLEIPAGGRVVVETEETADENGTVVALLIGAVVRKLPG